MGNHKELEALDKYRQEEEDLDNLNSKALCPDQTTTSDLAVLTTGLAMETMSIKEAQVLVPGTTIREEKSLGTHLRIS